MYNYGIKAKTFLQEINGLSRNSRFRYTSEILSILLVHVLIIFSESCINTVDPLLSYPPGRVTITLVYGRLDNRKPK